MVAKRNGRPPDMRGQRGKRAMVTAWDALYTLSTKSVARRARIKTSTLYSIVDPKKRFVPTAGLLRPTASMFREYASRLVAEALRLDRTADTVERLGPRT